MSLLTSTIVSYDSKWIDQYAREIPELEVVFGRALIELHHVGSTAVPGLSAKPEIDILAIVDDLSAVDCWTSDLSQLGYKRGGNLSSGHMFYKCDSGGVRTKKVHVCLQGHEQIARMLTFRDCLRSHREVLLQYQELKLSLEKSNTKGISEYVEGKTQLIQNILAHRSLKPWVTKTGKS